MASVAFSLESLPRPTQFWCQACAKVVEVAKLCNECGRKAFCDIACRQKMNHDAVCGKYKEIEELDHVFRDHVNHFFSLRSQSDLINETLDRYESYLETDLKVAKAVGQELLTLLNEQRHYLETSVAIYRTFLKSIFKMRDLGDRTSEKSEQECKSNMQKALDLITEVNRIERLAKEQLQQIEEKEDSTRVFQKTPYVDLWDESIAKKIGYHPDNSVDLSYAFLLKEYTSAILIEKKRPFVPQAARELLAILKTQIDHQEKYCEYLKNILMGFADDSLGKKKYVTKLSSQVVILGCLDWQKKEVENHSLIMSKCNPADRKIKISFQIGFANPYELDSKRRQQ